MCHLQCTTYVHTWYLVYDSDASCPVNNQRLSRLRAAPPSDFIFWELHGAVQCGFHFFKSIRCGAVIRTVRCGYPFNNFFYGAVERAPYHNENQ